jgi:hypothetical protein
MKTYSHIWRTAQLHREAMTGCAIGYRGLSLPQVTISATPFASDLEGSP